MGGLRKIRASKPGFEWGRSVIGAGMDRASNLNGDAARGRKLLTPHGGTARGGLRPIPPRGNRRRRTKPPGRVVHRRVCIFAGVMRGLLFLFVKFRDTQK